MCVDFAFIMNCITVVSTCLLCERRYVRFIVTSSCSTRQTRKTFWLNQNLLNEKERTLTQWVILCTFKNTYFTMSYFAKSKYRCFVSDTVNLKEFVVEGESDSQHQTLNKMRAPNMQIRKANANKTGAYRFTKFWWIRIFHIVT